jgi:hypothetical protein
MDGTQAYGTAITSPMRHQALTPQQPRRPLHLTAVKWAVLHVISITSYTASKAQTYPSSKEMITML